MPIYTINNSKLAVMNEDKTRGLAVEFPKDMGLGELLDRIEELKIAVIKSMEEERKKEEEAKKPVVEETK